MALFQKSKKHYKIEIEDSGKDTNVTWECSRSFFIIMASTFDLQFSDIRSLVLTVELYIFIRSSFFIEGLPCEKHQVMSLGYKCKT